MPNISDALFLDAVEKKRLFQRLYPELLPNQIKTTWSRRYQSKLYREGYKFCCGCRVLIKILETYCRCCKRRFRTRVKTNKFFANSYAEPITKIETVKLGLIKI